jgi:hypothetical protein
MANVWWAYDESTGNVSSLPASPLLIPCAGLFFLLALFDKLKNGPLGGDYAGKIAPEFDVELFQQYSQRYKQLMSILSVRELTESESDELKELKSPPWAEGGEVWTY